MSSGDDSERDNYTTNYKTDKYSNENSDDENTKDTIKSIKNKISNNLAGMNENKLTQIFDRFDINKDGKMDFSEFRIFIEKIIGRKPNIRIMQKMFKSYDIDGNNIIDLDEFMNEVA